MSRKSFRTFIAKRRIKIQTVSRYADCGKFHAPGDQGIIRPANSEQRTANSEQRTANSEQRTANSDRTVWSNNNPTKRDYSEADFSEQ